MYIHIYLERQLIFQLLCKFTNANSNIITFWHKNLERLMSWSRFVFTIYHNLIVLKYIFFDTLQKHFIDTNTRVSIFPPTFSRQSSWVAFAICFHIPHVTARLLILLLFLTKGSYQYRWCILIHTNHRHS